MGAAKYVIITFSFQTFFYKIFLQHSIVKKKVIRWPWCMGQSHSSKCFAKSSLDWTHLDWVCFQQTGTDGEHYSHKQPLHISAVEILFSNFKIYRQNDFYGKSIKTSIDGINWWFFVLRILQTQIYYSWEKFGICCTLANVSLCV